jgi:bacteriocin resistance YdeI/OmpD-like protein/uncharacterized protein DUF1905
MPKIRFQANLTAIGPHTILRVPKAASRKLPSRGMSMVEGTLNGYAFQTPLEPDGVGSHWFRVSNTMLRAARAQVGDSVSVALEAIVRWPEPKVPADLAEAFASDPETRRLWMDITPVARWDWIRWIGSTRNRDTRSIRIEKTLSKLRSGKQAACCFNRSQCTDPSVSLSGVLLEPTPAIGGLTLPAARGGNSTMKKVRNPTSNPKSGKGDGRRRTPVLATSRGRKTFLSRKHG